MLFCAGIGASLIYWGPAEWVYYYTDPPMGIEPRSDEALVWATGYRSVPQMTPLTEIRV